MADQKIDQPHLITKPIQLLAAWLVGLSVVDASFLAAAKVLGTSTWECGVLVCAAVVNVPVFIIALFLLQTRFRPEMQEDAFYAQYINHKTGLLHQVSKVDLIERQVEEIRTIYLDDRRRSPNGSGVKAASVSVNDYLPFYKPLRQALREADIEVSSIFGKFNKVESPPNPIVIAISDDLTAEQIIPVLRVCCKFDFAGFYMTSRMDDVADEDIYLGAYGKGQGGFRPFSPQIKDDIESSTDDKSLAYLLKDLS